jgi:hypothetical protein
MNGVKIALTLLVAVPALAYVVYLIALAFGGN